MQDLPSPATLLALVAQFLREDIMPDVVGAKNFQLRVAINALDLSVRQMSDAAQMQGDEVARLAALLGQTCSLDDGTAMLCEKIAAGALTLATPGLADHLWATTMAKLAVDQPNYAAYRREAER